MKRTSNKNDRRNRTDGRAIPQSARRQWAMRLMAMLFACLPFVALEFVLRALDDSDTQVVDYDPYVGLHQLHPLFVMNEAADRWEIPSERFNFFRPDSFSAVKATNTRRIFVLGGSTVQGRPYETETAFSTWLRLSLESADGNSNYEVINCGGVSYASYRVAKILNEVLNHEPDAIVLYTGHNEFLEDRTYAHIREMGAVSRWATTIGSKLHTIRWIQSQFSGPVEVTSLAAEVDAKQDHPGGYESYQRDPNWRRGVEQHFTATLETIVTTTRKNKVPLIICIPASDLVNTPPIKTQSRSDWTKEEASAFQSAWLITSDSSISPQQRMNAAHECLQIDQDHAGVHYILGKLLYHQGDSAGARKHLAAARDNDVCPLRAPTSIIQATRQIAEQYAVPAIDTIKLLDERNSNGDFIADQIPDATRFVDHVHPSIAGHQVIAKELALEFQKLGWIELTEQSDLRFDRAVAEHLNGLGEDYHHRGKQRLEGLRLWTMGRAGKLATDIIDETVIDETDQQQAEPKQP